MAGKGGFMKKKPRAQNRQGWKQEVIDNACFIFLKQRNQIG